jgi:hypothetical protein
MWHYVIRDLRYKRQIANDTDNEWFNFLQAATNMAKNVYANLTDDETFRSGPRKVANDPRPLYTAI